MDENEPKSPWDALVNELGADPTPEASERRQPQSKVVPSVAAEKSVPAPDPKPSDWNALAGSLGLEVPAAADAEVKPPVAPPTVETPFVESDRDDEVVAAVERAAATREPEERAETTVDKDAGGDEPAAAEGDVVADDSQGDATGDAGRSAFDALFSIGAAAWGSAFSKSRDDEDPPSGIAATPQRELFTDDTTEEPAAKESPSEDESDRPRRKRSRRRRGGAGRKRPSEPVEGENVASETAAPTDAGEESPADDGDAPTGKKRRRRRPRRRPKDGAEAGAGKPGEELRSADDLVDGDEGADDDFDATESGQGARRKRSAHQNLPTWNEAIGMIVDHNLEQRSKAPSRPTGSRGRGGRGGRGRGRKKS